MNSWEDRLNYFIKIVPDDVVYSKNYQKQLLSSAYIKLKAILSYNGNPTGSLKTPTLLIRPTEQVIPITEDYELSKVNLIGKNYFTNYMSIILYFIFISILNHRSWFTLSKEIIIQY